MIKRAWRSLVGYGFRLLYNECAFTYDAVSFVVSLGHWRRWQRAALGFLPDDGAVLEVAHGTGNNQQDLIRAGYRAFALDLSPYMSRLARRKLARSSMAADFVLGDALTLPFANDSFHAIICAFPTAFIMQDDCISEMHRVLQRGGVTIIVLAGVLDVGFGARLIAALYRLTGQGYGLAGADSIEQMFAGNGFEIDSRCVDCGGSRAQIALLQKPNP